MRKRSIFGICVLGVLATLVLTALIVTNQRDELSLWIAAGDGALNATPCTHLNITEPQVVGKSTRREVCEKLLALGSLVIPCGLQKECEAITEDSSDWLELFKRFLWYVQWHRDVYDRIAKNLTTLQETRTLTFNCDIFKRCTGLGATVSSIATGVLVAMYTKRFFVADQLSFQAASCWTDLTILPNSIPWKVKSPSWDTFEEKVKVFTHVVRAAFNDSNLHVFYGHPSIDHDMFFCKDLPASERNSATATLCREGLQRGLKWHMNEPVVGRMYTHFLLGAIARAAMHFSKAVNKQTDQKLSFLQKKGLPSGGYLAVHLRTGMDEHRYEGKYLKTGKFLQGDVNWRQRINCALQKASASGLGRPILLVTDSRACREWIRAHFQPKDVLVTNSSFFHFSMGARRSPSCDELKSQHHQLNDMVSEMCLLSRASILIPSVMSSFSEVSFYFSALPQTDFLKC